MAVFFIEPGWKVSEMEDSLAPEASHQPMSLNQAAKQTDSALLDINFMPQLENSGFLEWALQLDI